MSERAIETLLLPFAQGLLAVPEPGRGFLIRAESHPALEGPWCRTLVCEQTFKPAFDKLAAGGFRVETQLDGKYEAGLCLLTKHKAENLVNVARAWNLLDDGGVLVCAGANDVGARSVEAVVRDAVGVQGSLSKNHCRVFWSVKAREAPSELCAWLELVRLRCNADGTYMTRPGIFSWDRIDVGSRLLVESLPEDIAGDVADLGAGWGYISACLLKRHPGIRALDLYEAELLALDAARANLSGIPAAARCGFHWHDVTTGLPAGRAYDWIVMNPPFHSGKATDIDLGRAFIESAAEALRLGSRLVFVANRQLPYEAELRRRFASYRCLAEGQGFKVLSASR